MQNLLTACGDLHDLDHVSVVDCGGGDLTRQQGSLIVFYDDRFAS